MKCSFAALLVLATIPSACSDAPKSPMAGENATGTPPAPPVSPPAARARADKVAISTDLYEFGFTIPAEAMAIPGLQAQLLAERETLRSGLLEQANSNKREAEAAGFPYNANAIDKQWQRVADIPDYLSLSASIYEFSGGAHGNTGFDSLIWDRAEGKRIAPLDMFASASAFASAIEPAFCSELDRQRVKKRGGPLPDGGDSDFDRCIAPSDQTVILGSSNGRTFDRIGILIGPYAAGSYAEGSYEVTLPVTKAVFAAVKPQYQTVFSIGK